jgi:peptidoglycan/xylan/chitin deacetylase (PgdA/CDA1 family)
MNYLKKLYVALTFDDGTLHQYYLAKLLHNLGIKATFFLVTDLKRLNNKYLVSQDTEKILELSRYHEIASHTCTHRSLVGLSSNEIKGNAKNLKNF